MNVYDFDGTIYNGDSTVDFYLYSLKKNPTLLRYLPKQAWGFLLYFGKKIDKMHLKEYFFSFLNGIDCQSTLESFWNQNQKKIYNWYLKQKKQDDIIISASPTFLLEPICSRIGIKNLIASEVDPHTGMFISKNCHGQEKVRRLTEECNITHVENFYSDSFSDLPMAKIADAAFFVKNGCIINWKELNDTTYRKKHIDRLLGFVNKQLILYLFFGICTTLINMFCYGILHEYLLMNNILSTIVAWLAAVIFAFFTNKTYVFQSKRTKVPERLNELISFVGCRVITGILDVIIMAIAVDCLKRNSLFWKLISNIIVTVINYIASKFFIFKNNNVN